MKLLLLDNKLNKATTLIIILFMFSFSNLKSQTVVYPAPTGTTASSDFMVKVNGFSSFVYPSSFVPVSGESRGSFTTFSTAVTVPVEVSTTVDITTVDIRPKKLGITYTKTSARTITFNVPSNCNLSIEINGNIATPLFLFSNPLEVNVPAPTDPNVQYFGPGIHTKNITALNGQTIYIAGGAVIMGGISSNGASNFTVKGRGIINPTGTTRAARMKFGDNISFEGIVFNSAAYWSVVFGTCTNVTLNNIKIISTPNIESDALDIVGCQKVRVNGGFFRSEDDAIVIKNRKEGFNLGISNPEDIAINGVVIFNGLHSNGLEIGFELQGPTSDNSFVRNIHYKNIDIIHKGTDPAYANKRAAIAIHNNEDAHVSNISYEDIRIEDCKENFVWIGVINTTASLSTVRGSIDSVTLKNIQVTGGDLTLPSFVMGWDDTHLVQNVTFENFRIQDKVILNADQMKLTTNAYTKNILFAISGTSEASFNPVADAYVYGSKTGTPVPELTNYGTATSLQVKFVSGSTAVARGAFLKFDLTGQEITSMTNAKLRLYLTGIGGATKSSTITVSETDPNWTETAITYSNCPKTKTVTDIASCVIPFPLSAGYYEWDITSYLQSKLDAGIYVFSLMLDQLTDPSNQMVTFSSKESTSNSPQLLISTQSKPTSISVVEKTAPNNMDIHVLIDSSSEMINITLNSKLNNNSTLTFSDISGKVVYSKARFDNNQLSISTNKFAKGLYILNIKSGIDSFHKKLIIR